LAKHYSEKPIGKWNTRDFLNYMSEEHQKRFGIPYIPVGGWQREAGMLGNLIGTRAKPAKYSKETIKHFIDLCMENYRPNERYPGINFTFMYSYRPREFQQAVVAMQRKEAAKEQAQENTQDLEDWL
jgi:hypothetical protein